jgi:peroxiredoxin
MNRTIAIQTTAEARRYLTVQRDWFEQFQKITANFDEKANEQEIVAIFDDVITRYAGVRAPDYRWDGENIMRLRRPLAENDLAHPYGLDYAAQAADKKFQVTQLKIDGPAPDIVGKDLQGKPVKLSDSRGRITILTVGVYYSKDDASLSRCRELRQEYGKKLALVSVVENRSEEPFYAYNLVREAGIDWTVIGDPGCAICQRWCQITFPELYVIDAAGKLRFHDWGDHHSDEVASLVKLLMEEAQEANKQ